MSPLLLAMRRSRAD